MSSGINIDREDIARWINGHHLTTGMQVSSGATCQCGYWTGNEPDSGKRPLPWGRDKMDLHRADVVMELFEQVFIEYLYTLRDWAGVYMKTRYKTYDAAQTLIELWDPQEGEDEV